MHEMARYELFNFSIHRLVFYSADAIMILDSCLYLAYC